MDNDVLVCEALRDYLVALAEAHLWSSPLQVALYQDAILGHHIYCSVCQGKQISVGQAISEVAVLVDAAGVPLPKGLLADLDKYGVFPMHARAN